MEGGSSHAVIQREGRWAAIWFVHDTLRSNTEDLVWPFGNPTSPGRLRGYNGQLCMTRSKVGEGKRRGGGVNGKQISSTFIRKNVERRERSRSRRNKRRLDRSVGLICGRLQLTQCSRVLGGRKRGEGHGARGAGIHTYIHPPTRSSRE